jgi:hypothetical protein
VYAIFFLLGAGLYAAAPALGRSGNVALFCGAMCAILTMYGGGFAAIHGRLLTAWSVARILGPVVFNSLNEAQLRAGLPRAQAYDRTMLVLAMLLLVGFLCNLLVRPVVIRPRAS